MKRAVFLVGSSLVFAGCGVRNESLIDVSKMKFSSPTPESSVMAGVPVTDESQIKDALGGGDILVVISANDGVYAAGSVKKTDESDARNWYGLKEKGGWQIVWQGKGAVSCANLKEYPDYPRKFLPECVNDLGQTVKR